MAKSKLTPSRSLTPAVLYLRRSSGKQEASIKQQRVELTRYAAEHGYQIVDEYIDDSISGDATEKRRDFQRMIRDAAKGTFAAVLCWDQDRFGRFDPLEAGYWIKPLRDAGVRLVTIAQGVIDWESFAGRLAYTVQQESKHAYLRDLSRNVLRGKIAAAKAGRWSGKPPLGYRVSKQTKRLVRGPAEEVATVERIFADYLAGYSCHQIARRFNAEGVPDRSGRPGQWQHGAIRHILRNAAYCGDIRWNARHVGKYHGVRDGSATEGVQPGHNEESEWIVVRDTHPALIDRETFALVQRRLGQRHNKTPRNNEGGYLLTGLTRCGRCGAAMHGRRNRDGLSYYVCSDNSTKGPTACPRNAVRQDRLLEGIIECIQQKFLAPERVEQLTAAIRARVTALRKAGHASDLRKSLAALDGKLERAKQRLVEVPKDMVDLVADEIRKLRDERKRIESLLAVAQTPPASLQADAERRVKAGLAALRGLSEAINSGDPLTVREHLQRGIAQVEVHVREEPRVERSRYFLDRIVVHFNPETVSRIGRAPGRSSPERRRNRASRGRPLSRGRRNPTCRSRPSRSRAV